MKIISLHAVKVLEISITKDSKESILKYLQKYLIRGQDLGARGQGKSLIIVTPNTEQVVFAHHHLWFAKLLNRADVALPDAVGVVWASRFLSSSTTYDLPSTISTPIPGVDFMEDLVALAAKEKVRTAFIGGRGGVAVETFECLRKKYSGLEGWGEEAPELRISVTGVNASKVSMVLTSDTSDTSDTFDTYLRALAQRIVDTGTQIVFVALGPPKQELFMEELSRQSRSKNNLRSTIYDLPTIFMSVGGSFDEISGRIPRAPRWIQNIGFKWLWRLILEPWRIKRQLSLLEFIWRICTQK